MVHWTGNPFVDAGLAAIMAVVGVRCPEEVGVEHLEIARAELERILLSDQSLGTGLEKSFAKGALSQLFPNSELVNPSNWKSGIEGVRQRFSEALNHDLRKATLCLTQEGPDFCSVCGRKVPEEAISIVRKDRMPLLLGIVNFYPAFAHGTRICGLCSLALRFLPMSVLRTGLSGRLWFLHTQVPGIALRISKRYGWVEMNRAIAANKPLDFYSNWQTAGEEGTVLYVLCELLTELGDELREMYLHPLPVVAYVFSNDNQKPYVLPLPVPHELLEFFAVLHATSPQAFTLFWKELLVVPEGLDKRQRSLRLGFVQDVARRLLECQGIIGVCLDHGGKGDGSGRLRGGWLGHALYLQEVQKMPKGRLAILERLGVHIAQSEEAKKHVIELRTATCGDLYGVFLRYVRLGWLRHDEFYALLPPGNDSSAGEIRDILLAVIYAWQQCQENGEVFKSVTEYVPLASDETLKRIEQIGEQLLGRLPNPPRWIGRLQTARSSEHIRGVYLSAVHHGALSFADFVFLAPLGHRQNLWLLRDYLLAFLFERTRDVLPEMEDIAVPGEMVPEEA